MPKKPGLTLEQHKKLGLELATMYEKLVRIKVKLGTAYPLEIGSFVEKAIDINIKLRSALDSRLHEEHKNSGEDLLKIYYSPQGR